MIEKLNAHLYKDTTDMFEDCREKINEVIDAVNELQEQVNKTDQNLNFKQLEVKDLCDEDLHNMMKNPKYWRDKDPETVRRVEEGFKKLYGDKGE